jgi:magnesium chelatase subunit I
LAKANRGILFVDEVNLLDDSLVDVILDSAAGGWNTVEREGISVIHPAKFIMIGSGNQEEGEMRPQLLDRFGMAVTVATLYDKDARVQLVQNRIAFEADPSGFMASCQAETEALRSKLDAARARVADVTMDRELTLKISEVCSFLNVDGLRGDITVNRAAKAMAALEGSSVATQKHVERVIALCLAHRLRKDPLDGMDNGGKVRIAYNRVFMKEERAAAMATAAAAKPDPKAKSAAPAPAGAKPGAAAPAAAPAKKAGSWGGLGR